MKFRGLLYFLLLVIGLYAQPADIDSLETTQPRLASLSTNAFDLLQEDPEAALDSIELLLQLAAHVSDSIYLRNAHFIAFVAHANQGRPEQARISYRRSCAYSIPLGIRLDSPFYETLPFYNWRYNSWATSLEVLYDADGRLTFDQVSSGALDSAFSYSSLLDTMQQNGVYWVRTNIKGGILGTEQLFSVGGGMHSWHSIDIYFNDSLDQWNYLRSGFDTSPSEKAVRDAFNYFVLRVTRPDHQIYLRLEGPNKTYPVSNIFLNHIDLDSDIELEGYRYPGHFTIAYEYDYQYTVIQRSLEFVKERRSGRIPFDSVRSHWDALNPVLKDFLPIEKKANYWVRLKIIGSDKSAGRQLFMVGNEEYSWRNIELYLPKNGTYETSKSGFAVRKKTKAIPHGINLFELNVPPRDTLIVYMRLIGSQDKNAPGGIEIWHINETEFWQCNTRRLLTKGWLHAILWIQALFFLLIFTFERDRTHVFYSFLLMGISIFLLTGNTILWQQVISGKLFVRALLNMTSQFVIAFGILGFTGNYLDVQSTRLPWSKVRGVLLAVVAILVAVDIFYYLTKEEYPVYSSDNWVSNAKLVVFIVIFLIVLLLSIRRIRQGYKPAVFFTLPIASFIVCTILVLIVNLMDYDVWVDFAFQLMEISIALMVVLFSLGLGYKTNKLKVDKEEALNKKLETEIALNTNLQESNAMKDRFLQASQRFVPFEFIKALGRGDITEVKLGDHVQRQVTVVFLDMRDYTGFAEGLSPADTYQFIRTFNERIGPLIRQHHGFINDYIGDGIMAIFPTMPKDALHSAIEIQRSVAAYNAERLAAGLQAIKIGIGMHTGPLIMGIIGDNERMSATTIADTVNVASRIESLTKYYGANILLTGQSLAGIDQATFQFRYLGKVQVKGKSKSLDLYECFDGDRTDTAQKKSESRSDFQRALRLYFSGNMSEANTILEEISDPEDSVIAFFRNKSQYYLDHGMPENWTGVETMTRK